MSLWKPYWTFVNLFKITCGYGNQECVPWIIPSTQVLRSNKMSDDFFYLNFLAHKIQAEERDESRKLSNKRQKDKDKQTQV